MLYKTPSPYFIVLASSMKTEVKAIEFHRIVKGTWKMKCNEGFQATVHVEHESPCFNTDGANQLTRNVGLMLVKWRTQTRR